MSQSLVEARNVSMYPRDWNIVDSADKSDAGTSATLRKIVREWHEFTRHLVQAAPHTFYDRDATDPRFVQNPDGVQVVVEEA